MGHLSANHKDAEVPNQAYAAWFTDVRGPGTGQWSLSGDRRRQAKDKAGIEIIEPGQRPVVMLDW